jgi:hypothetical protein
VYWHEARVALPPHLWHFQLAEEVEPRKPGEDLVVYLLRLETMGLEPAGLFHLQPVLSKHREPPVRILPFRRPKQK